MCVGDTLMLMPVQHCVTDNANGTLRAYYVRPQHLSKAIVDSHHRRSIPTAWASLIHLGECAFCWCVSHLLCTQHIQYPANGAFAGCNVDWVRLVLPTRNDHGGVGRQRRAAPGCR
eukprot:m.235088 g.235088  ORF g.235088 m.235088 type:complete len:116 (+) comp19331_c0_seq3:1516-1863(+)